MDKSTTLMKTCNSCGLQKPLTAFLEVAGPEGTTYGNICASCRKAHIDKLAKPKEPEDSTTSNTGLRIDNKSKVQEEKEKKEFYKQIEEDYVDEREKLSEKQVKQENKKLNIAAEEKKHREEKRSFLDRPTIAKTPSKRFGIEEQRAKTEIDFSVSTENVERVSGTTKLQSVTLRAFKSFLGKSGNTAPIVTVAEKVVSQNTNENSADMDPLNEVVENNYRPRSK
jgi:hypothetical protein